MSQRYSTDLAIASSPVPTHLATLELEFNERLIQRPTLFVIDSGADMSCVPRDAIAEIETRLGLRLPYEQVPAWDFLGRKSTEKTYRLNFRSEVLGEYSEFIFIAIQDSVGCIGRDLLNQRSVLLDGPGLTWGICQYGGCFRGAT